MKRMWSEEEIQSFKKNISNLVDSKGNPRFVEGEGTPATIEGFTPTYCKWSLSGTHLMIVLAGTFANASQLPSNTNFSVYSLPSFIYDKIYAVWGNNLEIKTINAYAEDWTTQAIQFKFMKTSNKTLAIQTNNVAFTAKRSFRVQFDLLIDSE